MGARPHIAGAPPAMRVPGNTCVLLIQHGHQKLLGEAGYEFTPAVFQALAHVIGVRERLGYDQEYISQLRRVYRINRADYLQVQNLRAAYLDAAREDGEVAGVIQSFN